MATIGGRGSLLKTADEVGPSCSGPTQLSALECWLLVTRAFTREEERHLEAWVDFCRPVYGSRDLFLDKHGVSHYEKPSRGFDRVLRGHPAICRFFLPSHPSSVALQHHADIVVGSVLCIADSGNCKGCSEHLA